MSRARIRDLQARISVHATAERRDWWTRYLKGTAQFRGVTMGEVRREVRSWHADHELGRADPAERAAIAVGLIRQIHTEDKLAGMLLLQEHVLPEGAPSWSDVLADFAALFDEGFLADWNAVDWFCVKVLGPLSARDGEAATRAIGAWRDAPGVWRCRASAVAFVNRVGHPEPFEGFHTLVLESCRVLAERPERFAQTGAGWVLRELSVRSPGRVADFVRAHHLTMSKEALRSAVKRLPEDPLSPSQPRHSPAGRPESP